MKDIIAKMNALLEEIIADFHERPLPALTPRETRLPALKGKIDAVIGMRRTGKTWFLYQRMQSLLAQGIPRHRLLYVNFDDDRLHPFRREDLSAITEVYYRLYPDNRGQTCFFFFDEIQNVDGWELFLRRLLDTEELQLAVTGSSARLLSREIATSLRGRALTTEIFPFSFREALQFQGVELTASPPGAQRRALYANRLRDYLLQGGFPEVQGVVAPYHHAILQGYVDVVILRDVVERHGVSNIAPLRYLIRHLLGAPATLFSIHRFHNDLKSQGIACGKNTLHEYLDHLTDVYLVEMVPIHSRSPRQQQVNPRKAYVIDTGLALAFRHQARIDRGRLLENLVFGALRRKGRSIAYYRTTEGYEVDFHASADDGSVQLIQVCESLQAPDTRQRELRALTAAMRECGLQQALMVSLEESEWIEQDDLHIQVIPAWRWLLDQSQT